MNSKGLHRNDELPFEPGSSSSSSSSSSDEEPVDQETQQQRRLEPLQLLFITLSALQGYIGEGLVINDLQGRPRGTEQDYLFPAYGHLLAHSKDYHDHSTLESPDTTAALMQYRKSIEDEIVKQEQCHVDALDEIITLKQQQSASPITATKTTPKNSKAFHIIRGEENALWDCGLILDAAKYGFPEDKGHAAIAQWAQEYREICQIIPLEIKTGQIHNNWLKNTAPYFLIYLTHLPDTIFALPRNRITGFESSRNAMRIPRRAIQNRAMLPHAEEALAPYAWPISGIHDFLKQLASGQDTIQNPINGVVVHQRLEGFPVTLSKILDAKIAQRVVCNQAIEQFMSYFENMDEIRFESPPAAPIGGDLVMYWCGIPITIQHKAGHSTHFVQKGYKPHLKYDFIVWDTLSGGEVVVYARGAPTFEEVVSKAFDKRTGRRKLGYAMLEFIKKHVVEAKRAWIRDIRDQKIVPESIVSRKLKKATEEAAEVWEDERAVEEGIVHEETVQEVMDIRQGDKKDKKGKTDEPPDDAGQRKLGREQQNALLLNLLGAKLNKSARNRMPPSPIRLRVLDKDQCHPFGSAVILRCTGDVNNIPESGEEAVDLISTDPEDYNRPCIHVRCAVQCPDYSVRLRLEDHEFPLDASKEYLPITNQAFVLFSSTPLETIEKGLPSRILCLPSERMQVSTQILHEQREINVPVAPSEQRPSHGFMRRSQFGIRKHSYRGPQLGYWMEIDQIIENFEAIFGAAERGQDASFMISQGISRSDNIGAKSYVMTLGKCLQGLVDYGVGIPGKVTRQ